MNDAVPTAAVRLEQDRFGQLVLIDATGQRHVGVQPVQAFPLSAVPSSASEEALISLLGRDGRELLWIERFDQLDAASRALLEAELASRQFMPRILRLLSVSSFSTPSNWQIETDRGTTQLELKSEDHIRRLPDGRLLISDGHGVGYLVEDRTALDRQSRRLLERFL